MPTILVTGFRAFADEPRNPSGEIAGELRGVERAGCRVEGVILPVVRAQVLDRVAVPIDQHRPDAVIALGLARSRGTVSVERVARNHEDYRIPDEIGEQPLGEPVKEGGPRELRATLPVEDIVREIVGAGVPAELSEDAGAFICNRLYYGLLHRAAGAPEAERYRAVFLHLPPVPADVGAADDPRPSLALELTREAVEAALRVTARALTADGG